MKKVLFIAIDVIFHILFWTGLPITLVSFRQITSIERVVKILTGQVESKSPMNGCQGSVAEPPLIDVKYQIYLLFERSQFSPENKAYFDDRQLERSRPFWETLGATLRLTILDNKGRAIPLVIREFPNYDFCSTQTHSGQGIGILDNTRLKLNEVTVHYAIERNCEKLLPYHLQIRFYALDHNELLLTKMGLVLLLISGPWVIIKRLPRAYAKFARRKPTTQATPNN